MFLVLVIPEEEVKLNITINKILERKLLFNLNYITAFQSKLLEKCYYLSK